LIVSNGSENCGDWIFKLADLGISNFKGRKPGRQDSADKNARGTRTYGRQCSIEIDTRYTDILVQAPLKVTGLMARMCMTLSEKGRIPISGR
jgi:hypothetical protein